MELTLSDGTSVFAATGGRPFDAEKPVVMFLHGAGMDHTVWAMQARYFSHHGYSVLSVDLPAHGRSDGKPPESIPEHGDRILDLIEASGAKDVRLVGHSMGALITLEVAGRADPRVKAAALLGVVPEMKVHPDLLSAARAGKHAAIETVVGWGVGRRAQMAGIGRRATVAGASLRLLEQRAAPVLGIDFAACDAWDGALTAASNVRCPTLVLSGADDRMTPPKLARPLISAIDGAEAVTLARAGHMMMVEQPDETLDALAGFIDGVPA